MEAALPYLDVLALRLYKICHVFSQEKGCSGQLSRSNSQQQSDGLG